MNALAREASPKFDSWRSRNALGIAGVEPRTTFVRFLGLRQKRQATALFDGAQSLLQPLNASGAALIFEGHVTTIGDVPGTPRIRDIGAWLDRKRKNDGMRALDNIVTASFTLDEPSFADIRSVASGLIAAPLSASEGEYLVWFRPERITTVTWGGDPLKAVIIGDDPSDLSPRRSFAQWHQLVEGKSEAWSLAEIASARMTDTARCGAAKCEFSESVN